LNRGRLEMYNRLRGLRERLQDPIGYLLQHPTSLLWLTIPLGFAYIVVGAWGELAAWLRVVAAFGGQNLALSLFPLETLDDLVIQALIFVLGSFAILYETRQRYLRRIEAVMPDFLDRLASANEAGMPIVGSLERVTHSDLGELNEEMARTWRDVRLGTSVQAALHRLERRLRSPSVTRATTLITNAMRASGDLGPVLRIAADEAQASRRLQLQRRQELLTYVVVIYVSFFVFLTIIVALSIAFLPAIPSPSEFSQRVSTGFGGIPEATKAALQLVFFHTVIVQAIASGLVAGHMGQGSVKDGAKHAAIMLVIGYAVFLVVG
jgi:flagellar protein FlaJ